MEGSQNRGSVSPLDALIAAPEEVNPALLLAWRLRAMERRGGFGMRQAIEIAPEIQRVGTEAEKLTEASDHAIEALRQAVGIEAHRIPAGF